MLVHDLAAAPRQQPRKPLTQLTCGDHDPMPNVVYDVSWCDTLKRRAEKPRQPRGRTVRSE